MRKKERYVIPTVYWMTAIVCLSFAVMAFVFDSPAQILAGYYKIHTSRSVLVTDYIGLGGLGAALLNAGVSGLFFLILLILHRQDPKGVIVASLWTTIGFSLFGKNLANTMPILLGVLLYGRVKKIKFKDLFVPAMLSGTIAPLVTEIAFLQDDFSLFRIIAAIIVGLLIGFIFPVVTDEVKRVNKGFCLYNCGTAGGFIATFCVGLLRSVGIEIIPESIWDMSHTQLLGTYVYILALALILFGIIKDKPQNAFRKYKQLLSETDPDGHDYLIKYGYTSYINMGTMIIIVTTVLLIMNIPINGPMLGGIFTVAGFALSGKNPRSTITILTGSIIASHLNYLDPTSPANSFAILFSTGLAPIAAKFGMASGIFVGFAHVSIAIFVGQLNGGLNLYNNGFAGGFSAITIVPIIVFFKELLNRHNPAILGKKAEE